MFSDRHIVAHYMLETSACIILAKFSLYSFSQLKEKLLWASILLNSKNQTNIEQSAGNEKLGSEVGTSETIRVLSDDEWLAGVIDGDGNFDIRVINDKRVLKSIRITQAPRDSRVISRVKSLLNTGYIRPKGVNALVYSVSTREGMTQCVNRINGHMRIKIPGFKDACEFLDIPYKPANPIIPTNSSYLAGLIDTDGSLVFNYPGNRIELHLEFKQNEFTTKLDFSQVIEGIVPTVFKYEKKNQNKEKIFYSIRFSYANVGSMLPLYQYLLKNRCYSDFKFFRGMQIKRFLEIRNFKTYPEDSEEFKIYNNFLKTFFTHMNESKPLPSYIR